MMTPQQIQEISFEKALFGGYDMDSVDDVLEPLTDDYIALYKENSVLKSKMRILVEKLEEYRKQEGSMQNALLAAQKTCDQMVAETEKKCAKLLRDAESAAGSKAAVLNEQYDDEVARLDSAKAATAQFLDGMEKRIKRQLELIDELRKHDLPKTRAAERPAEENQAFDFEKAPSAPTTEEKADALIAEIGMQIEETLSAVPAGELGSAGELGNAGMAGKVEPLEIPAVEDAPAEAEAHKPLAEFPPIKQKKFEDLKFGRNYDPNKD